MLAGIDEDAVDFRPTYDGRKRAGGAAGRFPNLLANGAAGIAVGMATSPSRRTTPAKCAPPPCI